MMDAAQARAIYEEVVRRRADPALIDTCYEGPSASHVETMDWIRTRIIEIAEKRRKAEEARANRKKKQISEDDL